MRAPGGGVRARCSTSTRNWQENDEAAACPCYRLCDSAPAGSGSCCHGRTSTEPWWSFLEADAVQVVAPAVCVRPAQRGPRRLDRGGRDPGALPQLGRAAAGARRRDWTTHRRAEGADACSLRPAHPSPVAAARVRAHSPAGGHGRSDGSLVTTPAHPPARERREHDERPTAGDG